jgi:hypothetical protein
LIKAIAKETDRHLILLKLADIENKEILNSIICCINKLSTELCTFQNIYFETSLIVIEDIDCDCDIVLSRDYQKQKDTDSFSSLSNYKKLNKKKKKDDVEEYSDNTSESEDSFKKNKITELLLENKTKIFKRFGNFNKLTLSDVLNVIDGLIEMPNRIMILTSNFPDRLDAALIRPGRIDIKLKLDYCSKEMIHNIISYLFDKISKQTINDKLSDNIVEVLFKKQLTPALVINYCKEWNYDLDKVIYELQKYEK